MKYNIDLYRDIRNTNAEERKKILFILIALGLCLIAALASTSVLLKERSQYVGFNDVEKQELAKVEAEYQNYQETSIKVQKEDLEKLNQLQESRVYWTRILEVLARNLPENFWLEAVSYKSKVFEVHGFGRLDKKQDQLVILDDYLKMVHQDSTLSSTFFRSDIKKIKRVDWKMEEESQEKKVQFSLKFMQGQGGAR